MRRVERDRFVEILHDFWENFKHNLFKPLLLFFYMGFSVPILKVGFEFPYVIYQGLTIYLLVAIGWHGGEELAALSGAEFRQAGGFMIVGFVLNFILGILAYLILRAFTRLRKVDAATVAAYYGSDSAGTFVTCVGVLTGLQSLMLMTALEASHIKPSDIGLRNDVTLASVGATLEDETAVERIKAKGIDIEKVKAAKAAGDRYKYAPYMPVMLAVMEIPGCLVGLYLVSQFRHAGMDRLGNMPNEPGYDPSARPADPVVGAGGHGHGGSSAELEVEKSDGNSVRGSSKPPSIFSAALLHEVFLNPGLFLLFGGILIGYVGRIQGKTVTDVDDPVFVSLFQGFLCLFLLEMGMTASRRLKDLKTAGWKFIACALIMPNIFATIGMIVAHGYSHAIGEPFELGTYALFAVLCGAASYIAVPAVQRMAIPEASPTLPLAASLGCTFSYNVTIGIPVYIEIAKLIMKSYPVHGTPL
jgi:hypothetical protein